MSTSQSNQSKTSQLERAQKKIITVCEELNKHGIIPSHRHTELEARLAIAFSSAGRRPRAQIALERKQILANTRKNKARKTYLTVLDRDPHIFLPFILAISPRGCSFDVEPVLLNIKARSPVQLNIEVKALLDDVAKTGEFIQNPHYDKLLKACFPQGHINYRYSQTSISCLPVLDGIISEAIKASVQWRHERKAGGLTTDCIIALIPRSQNQDISIIFSVGHNKGLELINQLQPDERSEDNQPIIEKVQMEISINMELEKGNLPRLLYNILS